MRGIWLQHLSSVSGFDRLYIPSLIAVTEMYAFISMEYMR